jgi:transposase
VSGAEFITRRRKWSPAQKAALLEEVDAEGGKVAAVARRHGISESLLYNWRSAWKAAASAVSASEPVDFVSLGIVGEAGGTRRPLLALPEPERSPSPQAAAGRAGTIEIALPNGVRICVAGAVSEKALSRVLRAMRGTL